MTQEQVHPNVARVVAAGRDLSLEIEPFHFPDGTKTAADAAAAIGVDVGQIVKSLIFAVDGDGSFWLTSADATGSTNASSPPRLGARRAPASMPTPCARRPASRSAVCHRSDTPPRFPVFVDPDLLQYDVVWAAAGTWNDVFAIAPDDLVRASNGTVTDLRRS